METTNFEEDERGRDEMDAGGERATDRDSGDTAGGFASIHGDGTLTTNTSYTDEWKNHPEGVVSIETSQIREGPRGGGFGVLMVPVEYKRGPKRQLDAGNGKNQTQKNDEDRQSSAGAVKQTRSKKDEPHSNNQRQDDRHRSGERGEEQQRQPAQGPSRLRILLISGTIALVSGVAGAWSYSYVFSSSKENGRQPSNSAADSRKSSRSSAKGATSSAKDGTSGKGGSAKEMLMPPE